MDWKERKQAFVKLGAGLQDLLEGSGKNQNGRDREFNAAIEKAGLQNPWFIEPHVRHALHSIAGSLEEKKIDKWLGLYETELDRKGKVLKAGVVLAGNVPAVGFHDFLCVLISGHDFLGKLSSQDKVLLPMIAGLLIEFEPRFAPKISFTEGRLENFDAVIATGSDNTARYFEYYFGKYPNIIRKNRNGIAVLDGSETKAQLQELGKDIFLHFGLGCRNVSKLFVPEDYRFDAMFEAFENFSYVAEHHKYMNNYDYFKSIYLINREEFFDNNFLLLKNETRIASPVSVLFYENYKNLQQVAANISRHNDQVQCIIADKKHQKEMDFKLIDFGEGQSPELWDYADNIDTMKFLLSAGK